MDCEDAILKQGPVRVRWTFNRAPDCVPGCVRRRVLSCVLSRVLSCVLSCADGAAHADP